MTTILSLDMEGRSDFSSKKIRDVQCDRCGQLRSKISPSKFEMALWHKALLTGALPIEDVCPDCQTDEERAKAVARYKAELTRRQRITMKELEVASNRMNGIDLELRRLAEIESEVVA